MLYVFFFKQKTAYEMRISDWSSDVCSSDLGEEIEDLAGMRPVRQVEPADETAACLGAGRGPALHVLRMRRHGGAVVVEPVEGQIGRASCRERVCQYV